MNDDDDVPRHDYLSAPLALSGGDAAVADPAAAEHPFDTADDARYEARGPLGEGGMGRVGLAHDRRLLRLVARKVPRRNASAAARLAQEAWITAQLDHPGIVSIYDAGRAPDGSLFYTMRLVRGRSLEEALAGAGDLAGRLGLLRHYLAACEAVAFAHRAGVVHRDLKPQNVMVGDYGETQVVDWGVARPVGDEEGAAGGWRDDILPGGHAAETLAGDIVGTPGYMSPEQADPRRPVDRRADVWSLGAILYRLLAGAPPFAERAAADIVAALRRGDDVAWGAIPAEAPRELVAIARHALARDPDARYADARALAHDVAAYLDGRLVSAHSYTPGEHLRRFVRAFRLPLLVALVALAVLVAGAIVATGRVVGERDRALDAERAASAARAESDRHLAGALLGQATRRLAAGARPEAEVLAAKVLTLGESPEARGILMAFAHGAGDGALRELGRGGVPEGCARWTTSPGGGLALCLGEATELWRLAEGAPATRAWALPIRSWSGAFADDDTVVIGDYDGRAHVVAAADGRALGAPLPVERADHVYAGAGEVIAARGDYVFALALGAAPRRSDVCAIGYGVESAALAPGVAVGSCEDGTFVRLDLATGALESFAFPDKRELAGSVGALTADGAVYAVVSVSGRLAVVDVATGALRYRLDLGVNGARDARWSPDGARLAIAFEQGGPEIRDGRTGGVLARLPRRYGRELRWLGDEELLTFGRDGWARWAVPRRLTAHVLGAGVVGGLSSVAVRADGERVALARGTGALDLLDAAGLPVGRHVFGDQVVKRVLWPAGEGAPLYAAVMGHGGLYELAGDGLDVVSDGRVVGRFRRLDALAGGRVVTASWVRPVEVFGADGARLVPAPGAPEDALPNAVDVDASADGSWAAVLEDGTGRVFRAAADGVTPVGHVAGAVAVGAGAGEVAVASASGLVVLGLDGAERLRVGLDGGRAHDVEPSPDGRVIAVAMNDGTVRVLRRADGALLARLVGHADRVVQVLFGGGDLFTASWDGTSRRYGLGPLEADPAALLAAATARWGLALDDAIE
ncbi:MAG: protein kinase [Deltaproteobacteria bacterium]|nr:protein kinase [Deltaproteobacteria bacterium]